MKITIMTLFKETIDQILNYSIMGRAKKSNQIQLEAIDIRPFAANKHHQVDDYPYGGGAGMLMMAQPICDCFEHVKETMPGVKPRVLYMTPQGKVWNQQMAEEFAKEEHLWMTVPKAVAFKYIKEEANREKMRRLLKEKKMVNPVFKRGDFKPRRYLAMVKNHLRQFGNFKKYYS